MNVNAANAGGGPIRGIAFVLRNGFLPVLLGAVTVVSVLPLNFAAFALWLALLASSVRKQLRQQRPALA